VSAALLIIDLQNDFLPGGALAVPHGDEVIVPINKLAASGPFGLVVATRDWHPPEHSSFSAQGGPWPAHCVAGTQGAQLDQRLASKRIDAVIDKGTAPDAEGYSAFESGELAELLRAEHVRSVTIAGLATDYCVRSTALDALAEGFSVRIATSATRGIDAEGSRRALEELAAAGAEVS
jgi:nicotinamidase/pyrazinamidase